MFFFKGLKNEFELAVVNEASEFEPLKFYCNYFSSLFAGPPETDDNNNPFLARFKNWEDDWPCKGKYVRGICVFGVGDLPFLATREELFANKFHQNFQPAVIDCLEELLNNRTIEEAVGTLVFDVSYYKTRDFVSNKV